MGNSLGKNFFFLNYNSRKLLLIFSSRLPMHEFVFSSFSCAGIFFCGNKSNPPARNGPSLIANGYMELVIIFTICITCGLKLQWYCKENWNAIILNRWSFTKRDQCFLFFFLVAANYSKVSSCGEGRPCKWWIWQGMDINFDDLCLFAINFSQTH